MLTIAAAVVIALPFVVIGCGSVPDEFDKTANYSAESLAQELILRYRALTPSAKTAPLGPRKKASGPARSVSKKSVSRTAKKSGAPSVDDLLDDIESKLTLIKGTSPAETTKKMVETISSDSTLDDGQKKSLIDLVGRLAD
jgi:hypothetical protein